jgi:hypothetical protein
MKYDSPHIGPSASSLQRKLAKMKSVHSLNESVYGLVDELTISWERILNRRFQRKVHVYSEENLADNESSDESNDQNCACTVDCGMFVRKEAAQRTRFGQLFESLFFNSNVTSFADTSFGFGFQPVFDNVGSPSWITGIDHAQLPVVEAGGGAGFGFQVYCNETVIVTAGFGGGGGLEHDRFQRVSFGGGGGGGVQFMNSTWSRQSLGGGGGCGTCDDEQETTSSIQCGFQMDTDAMDTADVSITWQQFATEVLPTCHHLAIHGGGGGGGGTGGCCDLYRVGYGFRFDLIASAMGGDTELAADDDGQLPEGDALPSYDEEQEEDAFKRRFEYDLVGWLLALSADGCAASAPAPTPTRITTTVATTTNSATTANWCCQCARAQQLLRHCLSSPSLARGRSHRHRSIDANDTVVGNLIVSNPTLCPRLRDHREQVQWLTTQRCCDTSEANDDDNGPFTHSDDPSDPQKHQTEEAFRVIGDHVFNRYELRWTLSSTNNASSEGTRIWMALLNATVRSSSPSSSPALAPSSSLPLIDWRDSGACRSPVVKGDDDAVVLVAGTSHPFSSSPATGGVLVVGLLFCVAWMWSRRLWRVSPRAKQYTTVRSSADDEEAGLQLRHVVVAEHQISNVVPVGYGSVS